MPGLRVRAGRIATEALGPRPARPSGATISRMTSDPHSAHALPASTLTIVRPDDWHLHVRDGDALHTVVPHTAAQFGRAIIMPNLRPPVTTAALAVAYKSRIFRNRIHPNKWSQHFRGYFNIRN